ncbi:MAG: ATP-binding protein [Pseudonocardiaceae bacterium]
MTAALRLDSYPEPAAIVLRPVGELTSANSAELRDRLLECARQEPTAIVVDLDSMQARTTASLMVFRVVCARISDSPGVPMVLVVARQPLRDLVETSTVASFVPTYRSVGDALDALKEGLPQRRRQLPLSGQLDCGRAARRLVEQTCQEWGVPEISTNAVLVACELTENVIRHARTEGSLCLELRGGMFTIAVTDSDHHLPRLRPPHERRAGGRGLVLVAELSRAWGYSRRAQGGKVVWSVLSVPGR